jgi:hypothetical protein
MNNLFEGGNVFKDDAGTVLTKRINRADVIPTIKWLETVTGLELTDHLLGTTGKKETSGDLDIAIDANEVDKNEFAAKLGEYIGKNGGNPKTGLRKVESVYTSKLQSKVKKPTGSCKQTLCSVNVIG